MQVLTERVEQGSDGANGLVARFEGLQFQRPAAPTTAANCERSHLVEQLLEGVGGKATFRQLAGQLRGFAVPELHALLKSCRGARSFGAMFWHAVKSRRARLSTGAR